MSDSIRFCGKFAIEEDIITVSLSYNERLGTLSGVFHDTHFLREPLKVVFSLIERRRTSERGYTDTPVLVTPCLTDDKFQLTFPFFGIHEFQVSGPHHQKSGRVKRGPRHLLTLKVVQETDGRRVGAQAVEDEEAIDLLEIIGLGSKLKVSSLYNLAVSAHQNGKPKRKAMKESSCLFRNKTPEYFSKIDRDYGGIMRPYVKDNNGDPDNPINGKLNGLFFCASVDRRTGQIPASSPFGSERLVIPMHHLVEILGYRYQLYFADFYCMNLPYKRYSDHYVTLVLTKTGSDADMFCQGHLIPLPPDNPFFQVFDHGRRFRVCSSVIVELFYTEDIDLVKACQHGGATRSTVESRGISTPSGFPKKPSCSVCNIRGHDEWKFDDMKSTELHHLYTKLHTFVDQLTGL